MIRHTIRPGETSTSIARMHGLTQQALLDANPQLVKVVDRSGHRDFASEHFRIGGVINVPGSGAGSVGACGGGGISATAWRNTLSGEVNAPALQAQPRFQQQSAGARFVTWDTTFDPMQVYADFPDWIADWGLPTYAQYWVHAIRRRHERRSNQLHCSPKPACVEGLIATFLRNVYVTPAAFQIALDNLKSSVCGDVIGNLRRICNAEEWFVGWAKADNNPFTHGNV